MGEKRRRSVTKTSILAILVLAAFAAAVGYVWSSYGSNRALTLAAAGVIVFALAWLVLTVVSFLGMASAGRKFENDVDEPLTNTQRAVPKRGPILASNASDASDQDRSAATTPDPEPEPAAPTPPPVAAAPATSEPEATAPAPPPVIESAPTADGTTPTPAPGRRRKNPGA